MELFLNEIADIKICIIRGENSWVANFSSFGIYSRQNCRLRNYLEPSNLCCLTRFQNCSLAVVGEGEDLQIFDDEQVAPYLEGLDQEERRGGAATRGDDDDDDDGGDGDGPAGGDEGGEATAAEAPEVNL